MSLTSEDLNLVVYLYLEEAGFNHSAFTFQQESRLKFDNLKKEIETGVLIDLVQKGLEYRAIESHIDKDGVIKRCKAPFTILGEHVCEISSTPISDEMEIEPKPKPSKSQVSKRKNRKPASPAVEEAVIEASSRKDKKNDRRSSKDLNVEVQGKVDAVFSRDISSSPSPDKQAEVKIPGARGVPESDLAGKESKADSDIDPRDRPFTVTVENNATLLKGHESEVYICAWNPVHTGQFATGSNDGSGRVWYLPGANKNRVSSYYLSYNSMSESKDVVCMDWNPKGTVLGLGCYDGNIRQYTQDGWLRFTAEGHGAPILAIQYNRKGTQMLTGSVDMTARIWCTNSGNQLFKMEWHSAGVTDIDWKDDKMFATCSLDGTIHVGRFEEPDPLYTFTGHKGPINAIKWNSDGSLIASCSDDMTIKLWTITQNLPIHTLKGHTGPVSIVKWAPSSNPKPILASGSEDRTVRLWDTKQGTCLYKLNPFQSRITSLTFSPNGLHLGASAFDSKVYLFSAEDGSLVRTLQRNGVIFNIQYSPKGDSIIACFADKTVAVFKMDL